MKVLTVITDQENVVIALGDYSTFRQDPQDTRIVYLGGCGYALAGQSIYHNVEVPEEVVPGLYIFDGEAFAEYTSAIDKIAQDAIDAYTLELIEGGLL